jgi:L-asparaginase II
LKVSDGASRARPAVLLAALAALGVDISAVAAQLRTSVLGHGHEVGSVESIVELTVPRRD